MTFLLFVGKIHCKKGVIAQTSKNYQHKVKHRVAYKDLISILIQIITIEVVNMIVDDIIFG